MEIDIRNEVKEKVTSVRCSDGLVITKTATGAFLISDQDSDQVGVYRGEVENLIKGLQRAVEVL